MLEYFKGVMFLTTNRLTAFDEAILSRALLPLRFDNSYKHAPESVWQNFLDRAEKSYGVADITPKELRILGKKQSNGRQVCNDGSVDGSHTNILHSRLKPSYGLGLLWPRMEAVHSLTLTRK